MVDLLGNVRLMARLDDLEDLLQPKLCYEFSLDMCLECE